MRPLLLSESDVLELLSPEVALTAVERSFERLARGRVDNPPRQRLAVDHGQFAVMACVDPELGYAGVKSYVWTESGTPFALLLFRIEETRLEAVIEADRLGQMRTGAASGVAARHLARDGARSLGVIGCGRQAATQIACIRAAVPGIERVLAYGRDERRLLAFCSAHGCEPAGSPREAAGCDIVVTATTAKEPVLHGAWLVDGALVCAVGANDLARRELDDAVLERAGLVCCDTREQSQLEAGDLVGPVAAGRLDWDSVHELAEVVSGSVEGRTSASEIVVFKSNGIAAWDVAAGAAVVELARARRLGRSL